MPPSNCIEELQWIFFSEIKIQFTIDSWSLWKTSKIIMRGYIFSMQHNCIWVIYYLYENNNYPLVLYYLFANISSNALQWRHNGHGGVSNHQPHNCLLNRLFRRRSKKTSKLRVTGLCAGNSPVTGEFPAQMVSNAENFSIRWRHHGYFNSPADHVIITGNPPYNGSDIHTTVHGTLHSTVQV